MLLMMAFPVKGQSLTFDVNPFKRTNSVFFKFPELRNKISSQVLSAALAGYRALKEEGKVNRDGILTVIDFNRPSVDERLFVIDVNQGRLLYSALVAHGSGSGGNYAQNFSNVPGSRQSSLGFYTTGDTYDGKNGYSLRLQGQERGVNDNAESRSIVIHGANYVSYDFIRKHGRLGIVEGGIGDNLAVQGNAYFRHEVMRIKTGLKQFMIDGDGIIFNEYPVGDNQQRTVHFNFAVIDADKAIDFAVQ